MAFCITGRAPYNEVYYFTRFEKDETMIHENDAAEILCNRTRAVQS